MSTSSSSSFDQFSLDKHIDTVLCELGYETPSPIQQQVIPLLLEGRDVIGQAQTGTGKTAAFALPLLSRLVPGRHKPQALVLTPTRELAIQVSEAFKRYAAHCSGFEILAIYGGQEYGPQLRALKKGVDVVIGTPGRIMDHMRRGTLALSSLSNLVLDEADEMLRMGFIEDIEWICQHLGDNVQRALFSATMPNAVRRIAGHYLHNAVPVTIQSQTATAPTVEQYYCEVKGLSKEDILRRLVEAKAMDGVLVFVRTKAATVEIAGKLNNWGVAAAPLHGDISQTLRERTVEQLRHGQIDMIVATDVAARGLDVSRISHVINYDIPYDSESYVHRIGRTGRAGRSGEAIMLVTPRERRLLGQIEKGTRQPITPMAVPGLKEVNNRRIEQFQHTITRALNEEDMGTFKAVLADYQQESGTDMLDIAAALASRLYAEQPLFLRGAVQKAESGSKGAGDKGKGAPRGKSAKSTQKPRRSERGDAETYRVEIGHNQGMQPGHLVGAIANEIGLDSAHIGRIRIFDDCTTVDLPRGLPRDCLMHLKKVRVAGLRLNIAKL